MTTYPPMTRLIGLWRKTSARNVVYYIGRLGQAKIVLLPNKDKREAADPDMIVYLQERESKPQEHQEERPIWDGLTDDPGEPTRKRDSRSTGGF